MARADHNEGKRGLRLKLLDRLNPGFARWLQQLVDASEAFFPRFGDFRSTYRSAAAWPKSPTGFRIKQALREQNELRGHGSADSLRSPLCGRGARG